MVRGQDADLALLGREHELRVLDGLLDQVNDHGAALILRGDAGVGKSVLLEYAARRAGQRSVLTLRTNGSEDETALPYAGLHQLVKPLLEQVTHLSDPQREALGSAFGITDSTPELFLVALAALSILSESAAEDPLLLVVDDAHWLDAQSVDVLTFVARRLEAERLVLLVSTREGFETSLDRAALPELALGPVGPEPAAALLARHAPELCPVEREQLLAVAAGNPLALVELPLAWRGRGPTTRFLSQMPLTTRLQRSFATRAQHLPSLTLTMLLIAALNDSRSLSELMQATALLTGEEPTLRDLAPAEAASLIDLDDQGVRFRHPMIRSAIREAANTFERHDAYAALAEILADDHDRSVWFRAGAAVGPDETVAIELDNAATRAQARAGGAAMALTALRRAAQLTSDRARRGTRLLNAAELAYETGHHDLVTDLLRQATPDDLTVNDRQKAQWLREFLRQGRGTETVEGLVRIVDEMIDAGRPDQANKCLEVAAQKCWWFKSDQASRDKVLAAAERIATVSIRARLLAIQGFADPIQFGAAAISHASAAAFDPMTDSHTMYLIGALMTTIPDFEQAKTILDAAITRFRDEGRMGLVALALTSLGDAALYSGDWGLVMQCTDECTRLARETGQGQAEGFALITQATLLAIRGEEERANGALAEGVSRLDAPGFRPMFCYIEIAHAARHSAQGRHSAALEHIRRVFDPSDPVYDMIVGSRGLIDLAEAAAHTDQRQVAHAAIARLEAAATQGQSAFMQANVSYARAILADDSAADELVQDALERHGGATPFIRARLLLNYGARVRRQQRPAESRPHLRAARDTFEALGAIPWAERARQELRASGEKSPRRSTETRDALTPQETQIARMAAAGLTNRQIGERLFLSHRTVGSHLYRIFPKLGITSRTDLAKVIMSPVAGDTVR